MRDVEAEASTYPRGKDGDEIGLNETASLQTGEILSVSPEGFPGANDMGVNDPGVNDIGAKEPGGEKGLAGVRGFRGDVVHASLKLLLGFCCALLPCIRVFGQDSHLPAVPARPAQFDVASVRKSAPDPTSFGFEIFPSGRFVAKAMTASDLVEAAYHVKPWCLIGGAKWIQTERYDVEAKLPSSYIADYNKIPASEQAAWIRPLLVSLLADRFALSVRREERMQDVYRLTVVGKAVKLLPSTRLDTPPLGNHTYAAPSLTVSGNTWKAQNMPMTFWADQLSGQPDIQKTVIDETGLQGAFDFTLMVHTAANESGASLFTALKEQLGLSLVASRRSVPFVVIENIERPGDN